ncbi:MAG TPA: glycosyltransferase family 87 protein [Propionibacteriaceae bacterium]|nr:glycosyltransferase family 87 protein [Propionibacteriaceae bacterium]
MRQTRLERWLAAALALQLLFGLVWLTTYRGLFDPRGMPLGNDFAAFWFAARLALRRPAVEAYDLVVMTQLQHGVWPNLVGVYAWVYPPSFILLVLGLGLVPYLVGYLTWTATTLGLFLAGLWQSFRSRTSWWVIVAFPGVWLGIGQGQNQFLTAGLAALGLGLLRRHPVWAGICIGLLALKPHLALLFPVALLAARAWRAIWSAAVTAVTVTLLPAALLGWRTLPAWLASMQWVSTAIAEHHLPVWMFPAPYPWLVSLGIPAGVAAAVQAAVSVLAAAVVYRLWRPLAGDRTAAIALPGAGLVLATFLATPYYAMYDLAWLAMPLCWLVAVGSQSGWRRGERPLLVGLFVLPYASVLALVVDVQLAPFVLAGVLWHVVQRAVSARTAAPADRTPAVL